MATALVQSFIFLLGVLTPILSFFFPFHPSECYGTGVGKFFFYVIGKIVNIWGFVSNKVCVQTPISAFIGMKVM